MNQQETSMSSYVGPLLVPHLLNIAAQYMAIAVLPRYIILQLDGNTITVGCVIAAGNAGLFLGTVPAGSYVSSHGPRQAQVLSAMVGMLGATVSLISYFLAQSNQMVSTVLLSLGCFMIGVSASIGVVACTFYISTTVTTGKEWVSTMQSSAGKAGMAFGSFFGSMAEAHCHNIAGAFGMQILFSFLYGLVAFAFCPASAGSAAGEKKGPHGTSSSSKIFGRHLFLAMTLILLVGLFRGGRLFLIPLVGHLNGYTQALVGTVTSLGFFVELAIIPAAAVFQARFGLRITFMIAALITAVALAILCCTANVEAYWFAAVVSGIGWGMTTGTVTFISFENAPEEGHARAQYITACRLVNKSSDVCVPLALGFLVQKLGTITSGYALLCIAAVNVISTLGSMQPAAAPQFSPLDGQVNVALNGFAPSSEAPPSEIPKESQ